MMQQIGLLVCTSIFSFLFIEAISAQLAFEPRVAIPGSSAEVGVGHFDEQTDSTTINSTTQEPASFNNGVTLQATAGKVDGALLFD